MFVRHIKREFFLPSAAHTADRMYRGKPDRSTVFIHPLKGGGNKYISLFHGISRLNDRSTALCHYVGNDAVSAADYITGYRIICNNSIFCFFRNVYKKTCSVLCNAYPCYLRIFPAKFFFKAVNIYLMFIYTRIYALIFHKAQHFRIGQTAIAVYVYQPYKLRHIKNKEKKQCKTTGKDISFSVFMQNKGKSAAGYYFKTAVCLFKNRLDVLQAVYGK